MSPSPEAIIIGAGISGLTAAFLLHRAGREVLVLEKSAHVGGAIRSMEVDGYLVEAGPNSTLETTPLLGELMEAAGCRGELMYADSASDKRFILKQGRLTPLPMTPGAFLKTDLFSLPAKLRLFKEPFIPAGPAEDRETIADFVLRRLGREFLDYAINPFVAGVYAGSPEQLSVKAAFPKLHALEQKYGGLIKGQIRGARERKRSAEKAKQSARMFSFHRGMQTLTNAIAAALGSRVRTGCAIESITPRDGQNRPEHEVRFYQEGKPESVAAPVLILAAPAYAAGELIRPIDRDATAALDGIFYPPCAVVIDGYQREDVAHPLDGFGYLIPQKENRKILGTIFTSTIFRGRGPDGRVVLTTFVGGARSPELALIPKDALASLVHGELRELLGAGEPRFTHITQWERAIPQYNLGHLERMEILERFEAAHPGIYFCANYRGGISVGDCVKSAYGIAERVIGQNPESRIQNSEFRIPGF